MKILLLIILISLVTSCSKNNNTNTNTGMNDVFVLDSLTLDVVNSGEILTSDDQNLGSFDQGTVVEQTINIVNKTSSAQTISLTADSGISLSKNSCILSSRNRACSVKVILNVGLVLGSRVSNIQVGNQSFNYIFSVTQKNVSNPSLGLPSGIVDLGTSYGTLILQTINIANKSGATLNYQIDSTSTNSQFTIISNCNNVLRNRSCPITIQFLPNQPISSGLISSSFLINGNNVQVQAQVESIIPSVPVMSPPVSLWDFGSIDFNSGSKTLTINVMNKIADSLGPIVISGLSNFTKTKTTCDVGWLRNRSCSITLSFNSNVSPQEYNEIMNLNAGSFTLNLPLKALVVDNSAPVACSLVNALGNGISSLSSVTAVSGNIPNCFVSTCERGFTPNINGSSCDSESISCNLSDVQLNGWTVANSSTISGNRIGNDVSNCVVASCNQYHRVNSVQKTCDNYKKHVFLVIGQSNAQGQGENVFCLTTDAPNPKIYQWSRGTVVNAGLGVGSSCPTYYNPDNTYNPGPADTWSVAREPLQHEAAVAGKTGFALKFAKNYLQTLSTNETVGLVLAARGGTSFISGQWKRTGANYLDAVAKINLALQDPEAELKGILWQQGESDSNINGHLVYLDNLIEFYNNLKLDVPAFSSSVPFLTSEMVPAILNNAQFAEYAPVVNQALNDLKKHIPMTYTISSLGTTSLDNLHFDKNSLYTLGDRYFAALSLVSPTIYIEPITNIQLSSFGSFYSDSLLPILVGKLSAIGGKSPYSYSILTQTASSLQVVGNEVRVTSSLPAGLYNYTIRAIDDNGQIFDKSFSMNVGLESPSSLRHLATSTSRVTYPISGTNILDFNSNFSISFMIKPVHTTGNHVIFSTRGVGPIFKGITISMNASRQLTMHLRHDSSLAQTHSVSSYNTLNLNQWNHIVLTWNANSKTVKYYFNGLEKAMPASSSTLPASYDLNTTANLSLMNEASNNSNPANTILNDLALWNTELSSSHVSELFLNQNALNHSMISNLSHYLKFQNIAPNYPNLAPGKSLIQGSGGSAASIIKDAP